MTGIEGTVEKYLVCVWKKPDGWYAEVTNSEGAKATGRAGLIRNHAITRAIEKLDALHEETTEGANSQKWPKDWSKVVKPPSAVS